MSKKLTIATMQSFIDKMTAEGTLHFPKIAKQLDLDWHKDIIPALKENEKLRDMFKNAVDNLRYEMLDNLYKGARDGKNPHKMIDAAMINAMLKVFKGGLVDELEEVKEEKVEGIDQEAVRKHLERLGLKDD